MVIFLILLLFNILKKIITNDKSCAIKVATAIPVTPNGGINKKPKIKIGLSIILSKKDKIKTFR